MAFITRDYLHYAPTINALTPEDVIAAEELEGAPLEQVIDLSDRTINLYKLISYIKRELGDVLGDYSKETVSEQLTELGNLKNKLVEGLSVHNITISNNLPFENYISAIKTITPQ